MSGIGDPIPNFVVSGIGIRYRLQSWPQVSGNWYLKKNPIPNPWLKVFNLKPLDFLNEFRWETTLVEQSLLRNVQLKALSCFLRKKTRALLQLEWKEGWKLVHFFHWILKKYGCFTLLELFLRQLLSFVGIFRNYGKFRFSNVTVFLCSN